MGNDVEVLDLFLTSQGEKRFSKYAFDILTMPHYIMLKMHTAFFLLQYDDVWVIGNKESAPGYLQRELMLMCPRVACDGCIPL